MQPELLFPLLIVLWLAISAEALPASCHDRDVVLESVRPHALIFLLNGGGVN